jgi:O-antigen ligase
MVSLPLLSPDAFEPIGSFFGEWWAFVFGLAAATLVACTRVPALLRPPRSVLVPLVFAALIALHGALGWAAHGRLALLACLYLLWAAAIMLVARALVDLLGARRCVTVLALCVATGAVVNALISIVQAHGLLPAVQAWMLPVVNGRAYGNLGQANHLADYLALGLASVGYLGATGRLRAVALAAAGTPMLYAMSLTGSRSSWLYLAALLVAAGVGSRRMDATSGRRLLVAAAAALGVFVAVQIVLAAGVTALGTEAVTTVQRLPVQAPGGEERWTIWSGAWRIFLEAPWIGAGFGRFAARFFEIAPALDPPLPPIATHNAHNLLLQLGAELGVPGVAFLIGGAVLWWLGARRGDPSPERWWLLSVLAVIGIHSLLEYPLWYAYFLGIASIVLGASDQARLELRRARLVSLGAVAALALGWFACVTVMSDYRVLRDFQVFRRSSMLAEGTEAVTRRLLEIERRSMLSYLVELGFARAIEIDRERLEAKLALNTLVMGVLPDIDVAYRQALLLALAGDAERARLQWDRSATLYPDHAEEWLKRARGTGQPELDALVQYVEMKGEKS